MQTRAEDIAALVLIEIDGEWDRPTSHGLNLRRSLVEPPRPVELRCHLADGPEVRAAWLVMAESPEDSSGYWVFHDPADDAFGLATLGPDGQYHHVGTYGRLWDALDGM